MVFVGRNFCGAPGSQWFWKVTSQRGWWKKSPWMETPIDGRYTCPLYKTSLRKGVLATTGWRLFVCVCFVEKLMFLFFWQKVSQQAKTAFLQLGFLLVWQHHSTQTAVCVFFFHRRGHSTNFVCYFHLPSDVEAPICSSKATDKKDQV